MGPRVLIKGIWYKIFLSALVKIYPMTEYRMAAQHRSLVIVTDGRRKNLSATRALGKSGFCVYVFGDSRLTAGF